MNTVNLIGRVTANPSIKKTKGVMIANFQIAVDKDITLDEREKQLEFGKPVANFPPVEVRGKQAELVEAYISKGKLIGITGILETEFDEHDNLRVFVLASKVKFI